MRRASWIWSDSGQVKNGPSKAPGSSSTQETAQGLHRLRRSRTPGADTTGSQFLEPDGRFPNHIPNPEAAEAIEAIERAAGDNDADLGIIFDTDVDRP